MKLDQHQTDTIMIATCLNQLWSVFSAEIDLRSENPHATLGRGQLFVEPIKTSESDKRLN
jgi:hypothetical protein